MATNVSQVLCAHKVRPSEPEQSPGQKRLVICCDGTWNNTNEAGSGPPTNVSRLSGAVAHKCCSGMTQIVYYHPGAGTESSKTARILGGAFGLGVGQDIAESYRFICDNYNPGDEIVIIGFSRGAFTARSIAGMVCALGFLNRAGLDELGSIFHDYETWQTWGEKKFKYDEKKREGPLACLTLENLKRLRRFQALKNKTVPNQESDEDLNKQLNAERQDWYEKMARLKNPDAGRAQSKMQLGEIAKIYREMLAKHQLSLTTAGATTDIRVPVEGKVKAVGVWDTVGSLGIPEIPPFYHAGRSEHELKFEGLDVHPNVEHAFHAIALDEWRKSFDCTLWGKKNNTKTNLRQVWFPGTHCNVGGGWADQQIATIALAWMADQLTSVGVEFNKYEMQRIFYHVNNGVTPRKWGLGMIHNPNGATSYPDRLWSYASAPYRKIFTGDKWFNGSTDYVTRTPGAYTQDGSKDLVIKPGESVHPCVRIRYLYGGLNMDDLGPWECRSLTERGYRLERRELPQPRDSRAEGVPAPYHTILGSVAPHPAKGQAQAYFHPEQPSEEKDLAALPLAMGHWVWVDKNEKLETLPEEQIGIWERMFIRVNEKILKWKDAQEAAGAVKQEEPKGFTSWFSGSGEKKATEPETKAAKWKDPNVPEQYGYHDFIVWQKGDLTPVSPRT